MQSTRVLTLGPDHGPLWVRPYTYPLRDRWVVPIVADGVVPPDPDEEKGLSCFGDTPAEAKKLALGYLGGSVEQN